MSPGVRLAKKTRSQPNDHDHRHRSPHLSRAKRTRPFAHQKSHTQPRRSTTQYTKTRNRPRRIATTKITVAPISGGDVFGTNVVACVAARIVRANGTCASGATRGHNGSTNGDPAESDSCLALDTTYRGGMKSHSVCLVEPVIEEGT